MKLLAVWSLAFSLFVPSFALIAQEPSATEAAPKKSTSKNRAAKNNDQGTESKKSDSPESPQQKTNTDGSQQAISQESGAPQPSPQAPKQDDNLALLGEFIGLVHQEDGQYEPLGLQIRPVGDRLFEAIQYTGGLPGQETFGGEAIQLVGRRSGDFVILSGGPWAIFVEQQHCLLIDREGQRVGRLERVQRSSPTLGATAPEGATVLFDGTGTEQFTTARMTPEGLLMEGADVKPMFQDFNLHVEFRLPYMPSSDGQSRGNSGCYLQSRYEVQILDSFAQVPQFNGCSSIYRFKAPDLNMCYPPLTWQTYDIIFTAPRWAADGSKIRNARITVWHNGVKTQDDVEVKNKTGAGKPEEPNLLPIRFQNHKDPVRFRNIWIVDRGMASSQFPVYPSQQVTSSSQTAPSDDTSSADPRESGQSEQLPTPTAPLASAGVSDS